MTTPRVNCAVCDTLPVADLLDLNLFMGDASRWPPSIWGIFSPPKGELSPRRQWYGGQQAGKMWLEQHGYAGRFRAELVRRHYRYDVTVIASDPAELLNKGIIAKSDGRATNPDLPSGERLDPEAYLRYFNAGILLGNTGLEMLAAQVAALKAAGEPVPTPLLMKIAEIGAKLATTQATLVARGARFGDADDSDEGFRAGSVEGGIPSPRMGHQRIRVVEGKARPVTDEGPADREHFSERDRQEGGEGLPH